MRNSIIIFFILFLSSCKTIKKSSNQKKHYEKELIENIDVEQTIVKDLSEISNVSHDIKITRYEPISFKTSKGKDTTVLKPITVKKTVKKEKANNNVLIEVKKEQNEIKTSDFIFEESNKDLDIENYDVTKTIFGALFGKLFGGVRKWFTIISIVIFIFIIKKIYESFNKNLGND